MDSIRKNTTCKINAADGECIRNDWQGICRKMWETLANNKETPTKAGKRKEDF